MDDVVVKFLEEFKTSDHINVRAKLAAAVWALQKPACEYPLVMAALRRAGVTDAGVHVLEKFKFALALVRGDDPR